MNFLNLGLPEIIFIIIIALIIFGPNNMVKSARDAGVFIRKVVKSPYWQEVWVTKRDLDELPKMLAKEAKLDETFQFLDRETRDIKGSVSAAMTDMIREVKESEKSNSESQDPFNHILPPAVNEQNEKTNQKSTDPGDVLKQKESH